MRWLALGILLLIAIGVITSRATLTPAAPTENLHMQDYGPAPELGNTVWLNTDRPLRLAALRGQVVAIDMWTFG